jgi:hypothetical protein
LSKWKLFLQGLGYGFSIRVGGYQEEVIEIYGPESSGRTTLTLHAAEAQKQAELLLLMRTHSTEIMLKN